MPTIPQWAKDQRQKGTEIKVIGGRYYLSKVTSKWDPTIKRARKISGDYLGVLTPDGLIPVHRKMLRLDEPILSKEFGASWLLASLTGDIREHLRTRFPDIWKELYAICLARTVRPCAFRYIAQRYENSMLSEALPGLALSGASITTLLKALGTRRGAISSFMKDFLQDEYDYLLFDGTGIVSFSRGMDDTQVGYNNKRIYDPQVNLLYAFFAGQSGGMPAYYRKFPGSIRDVSAFKAIVTEMGMKNIVVIADKGFGSAANFTDLDGADLQYIVPLRRNNIEYDRTPLMTADKSGFAGVFQFNDRPIWYYRCTDHDGHPLAVFQDGELRLKEEKDYLHRLFKRHVGYSEEDLRSKELEFGTIVLKTNLTENLERLYHLYRMRVQIEQMFDDYKNLMDLDTCYLQSDAAMEAWFFLNHLGMLTCYRVFELLRSTDTLKNYSVKGILQEYLSGVRMDKMAGVWRYEIIPKGSRDALKHIGVTLPKTPDLVFPGIASP